MGVMYSNGRPVYNTGKKTCKPKWNALDPKMCHPFDQNDTQDANQEIKNYQQSFESIFIKDSCDVEVTTTDTQAALNVQVGLQAAIALIISVSIADSSKADLVTQDLFEKIKSSQVNQQQTYIENSRGVKVSTTDTDIAVNAQVLLQVLLALIARLDIL
ncbi:spore coat protein X [Halobacillus karajensis]|nr:spore coat protein X [Halobacillus karajensis]